MINYCYGHNFYSNQPQKIHVNQQILERYTIERFHRQSRKSAHRSDGALFCADANPSKPRSGLTAEQKYRLFAEQVPEPPWRVEPQRLAPGVQRHRLFHLGTDLDAEIAEVLDGAEVDIGRVIPAVGQVLGARHVAAEHDLQTNAPVAEIREGHHGVAADPQHVFEHLPRPPGSLERL